MTGQNTQIVTEHTNCTMVAYRIMEHIRHGIKVIPEGTPIDDPKVLEGAAVRLERPAWVNFTTYHRIERRGAQRLERIDGGWKLRRIVTFYHVGLIAAEVTLVGEQPDGCDDDNETGWAVVEVGYHSRILGGGSQPEGWVKQRIQILGYDHLNVGRHQARASAA